MKANVLKRVLLARATVFVGLAMMVAVVLGAASTAVASNGEPWILGQSNAATAITKLGGPLGVNGPMVQLTNNNADANDTALSLNVQPGEAPMRVNSNAKVEKLNADQLDGLDSNSYLVPYAAINGDRIGLLNQDVRVEKFCDSGDRAVGGGFSGLDRSTRLVAASRIDRDGPPTGYGITVNASVVDDQVTVEVYCWDKPPFRAN